MKTGILMVSLLMFSFTAQAQGLSSCDANAEQIRLPSSDICVTDFKNPDTACLCNSSPQKNPATAVKKANKASYKTAAKNW